MPTLNPPLLSRHVSGSRSACELRISSLSALDSRHPSKSSSVKHLLPPIELRGLCAFRQPPAAASSASSALPAGPADSQAGRRDSGGFRHAAAAQAAAAVLSPLSPSRSSRAPARSEEDLGSSDDDVSQFTASSCSTVRGYGYQQSDSSRKSSARGPIKGGHRAYKKRRRSEPSEGVCCPRGHELVHSERQKPWFCHGCGRVSSACLMECFRCNRCNYNLCDQCWNAQVEPDLAPPPIWPRAPTDPSITASSVPQSVDEFLARANEDVSLPRIPPAFSRGLSPTNRTSKSPTSPRSTTNSFCDFRQVASQASTCHSFMNASGGLDRRKKLSKSPSPTRDSESQSRSRRSSFRSSCRSSRRSSLSSVGGGDPMLRIVSLSEWMAESGMMAESLADYAMSQRSGTDPRAAVSDLADMMIKGMSFGKPGQKLDKATLHELSMMQRCRFLPLEDVQSDLKIWQLTLLRRPEFRKIAAQYGRVLARNSAGGELGGLDAEFIARGADEDGHLSPHRNSAHGQGPGDYSGLPSDYNSFGGDGRGYGPGGGPGGQLDASHVGGGPGGHVDGDPTMRRDGQRRGGSKSGADASHGEADEIGPDGKPLYDEHGRKIGDDSVKFDADGNVIQGDGHDKPGGETVDGDGGPGSEHPSHKDGGDSPGGRHARQVASSRPGGEESGLPDGKDGLGEFPGESLGESDAMTEQTEEEQMLAAGQLFKIKKIAEQVILDEFANMLLPPPPLSAVSGSCPTDGQDDGAGVRNRSKTTVSQAPVIVSAGVKSNLADDFRKIVSEAFRLIDAPEETKKKTTEVADVEEFLKNDTLDPEVEQWLSRSTTAKLNSDSSSLLETHLRMRAERHGRRLQTRGDKLGKTHGNEGLWSRRLKSCSQSLLSISALDAFAETRAREKLATA